MPRNERLKWPRQVAPNWSSIHVSATYWPFSKSATCFRNENFTRLFMWYLFSYLLPQFDRIWASCYSILKANLLAKTAWLKVKVLILPAVYFSKNLKLLSFNLYFTSCYSTLNARARQWAGSTQTVFPGHGPVSGWSWRSFAMYQRASEFISKSIDSFYGRWAWENVHQIGFVLAWNIFGIYILHQIPTHLT